MATYKAWALEQKETDGLGIMGKLFTVALIASVSWALGYRTGALDEGMRNRDKIEVIEAQLERFTDKDVFRHAQKVSQITGTDLYQVLTGNR